MVEKPTEKNKRREIKGNSSAYSSKGSSGGDGASPAGPRGGLKGVEGAEGWGSGGVLQPASLAIAPWAPHHSL